MVLMMLGPIRFSVSRGAYQTLSRTLEIRVARAERAGGPAARQVLGSDETIDIEGVVYAAYRGGPGRLSEFRALARTGKPQMLTDGTGRVWGRWLIERVDERASDPLANGVAQRQEFRLQLGFYGEDAA